MPRFIAFIALIACLLVTAEPALAARTNKEGAAALEKLFTDLIGQYEKAAEAQGGTLETEGAIIVEQAKGYYAVTLPVLSYISAAGARAEIGMVAVNAQPAEKDGQWKMTVAVPSPIVLRDPSGNKIITMTTGQQSFSGIWHEKFRNFVKLDAAYSNIVINNAPDEMQVRIPDLRVIYDLEEDKDGLWSGPTGIIARGTVMDFDVSGTKVTIDSLALNSTTSGFSIDEARAYQETLDALNESTGAGDPASASGAHMLGVYDLVFGFLGKAWDGFTFDAQIAGLRFERPSGDRSEPALFALGKAGIGFSMQGFRENDVTLGMKMNYDGLQAPASGLASGDILPTGFMLDLTLNRLPFGDIVETGKNAVRTGIKTGRGNLAGLQLLATVPQFMTDAGTNIKIANSFGNEHYRMATTGTLIADLAAQSGFTGQGTTEVTGYDFLLASVRENLENPDLPDAARARLEGLQTTLTMLQLAGQQSTDENGRAVRSYDFALTKEGEMLLNGTDMSVLLQEN